MTFKRTIIRHVTKTSSTMCDPTKWNGQPFRFSTRRRYQEVRSKLRHVNRVHTPEADMRPLLPHRDLFLKSLEQGTSSNTDHHRADAKSRKARTRPRRGLGELSDAAHACGKAGDMDGIERVIDRVLARPLSTTERSRWHRAIILNTIHAAMKSTAPITSSRSDRHFQESSNAVDIVMSLLTSHDMLEALDENDVGAVLDTLVRHKLSQSEDVAAVRGELMSRALDTRLSARTYAQLLDRMPRLDAALSLLHRAVAVGVEPSTQMLNRILELCFAAGDGERAKRVVADMARRSLRPNRRTLATLLAQAEGFDGVDAVFSVIRRGTATPSPNAALLFLNAYANVVAVTFAQKQGHEGLNNLGSGEGNGKNQVYAEYVARCFNVIDWFFDDAGVGVPRFTLNSLLEHFAREGLVEASLRAWREMRRSWLGDPSLRSRAALYAALERRISMRDEIEERDEEVQIVELSDADDKNVSTNSRDKTLQQRLLRGMSEEDIEKVKRLALRELDIMDLDKYILGNADRSVSSLKNKATVLHRWARLGRIHDVREWIEKEIDRNVVFGGIDVRLLLPLLSDRGPTRIESLKVFLEYLSNGETVAGPKPEVVRRVTDRVWLWILAQLDEADDIDHECEHPDDVFEQENLDLAGENNASFSEEDSQDERLQADPVIQDLDANRVEDPQRIEDSWGRNERAPIRTLSSKDVMHFLREFAVTEADIDELSERFHLDEEEVEILRITSALLGDLDNVVRIFGEEERNSGKKGTD